MHVSVLVAEDALEHPLRFILRQWIANQYVLLIRKIGNVFRNQGDFLLGCLPFHSFEGLFDQLGQVEPAFLELEVESLELSEVHQVLDKCNLHIRLIQNVFDVFLILFEMFFELFSLLVLITFHDH